MGLIDDDGVVLVQEGIGLGLHEQDTVGHNLDEGLAPGAVLETDLVAHRPAEVLAHLLGDALAHRHGGHSPGLRVADFPIDAAACLEAHLGDLCRLSRARLPRDDDDRVVRIASTMSARLAAIGRASG